MPTNCGTVALFLVLRFENTKVANSTVLFSLEIAENMKKESTSHGAIFQGFHETLMSTKMTCLTLTPIKNWTVQLFSFIYKTKLKSHVFGNKGH